MIGRGDDLHALFAEIRVRHLMEPLSSFLESDVKKEHDEVWDGGSYDVIGVKEGGSIRGYWRRGDASWTRFVADDLLADSASIKDALEALVERERFFVLSKNRVDSIVTRSDLYKAPFRLFCYGLVTLLEARMSQVIEHHYGDSWQRHVPKTRLAKCSDVHKERKSRNEETRLFDCLQFGDKRDLITRETRLRLAIGRTGRGECERSLKEVEKIRNRLAHGHRLDDGCSWKEVIELVCDVEKMLLSLEQNLNVGGAG